MKKLLVLFVIALVSCSPDEIQYTEKTCVCEKTVFKNETYTYVSNGNIHIGVRKTILYTENVSCQDENSGSMGNDLSFEINCN